jgi:hypothetical protein
MRLEEKGNNLVIIAKIHELLRVIAGVAVKEEEAPFAALKAARIKLEMLDPA